MERAQASPADFGAGVGQAEEGLAGTGMKVSDMLAANAQRLQGLTNDRDSNQALNKYMVAAGQEWAKYGAMQGQAANDYYPTFQKNLSDLRDQFGSTLQSPMAKQSYDDNSRFMTTRLVTQGASHSAEGLRQSYKTTNLQNFDNSVQAGILGQNDMPSVAMGAARASDALRQNAKLDGMTDEQAENEATKGRGQYYARLFKDMLDKGSVGQAAQMYQTVRPNLDGQSILQIDQMMKPVIRKQAMDGWVNNAMGGTAGGFAGVGKGTPFTPSSLPSGISLDEDAMVRTVAGEAAGEPLAGQQGVAAVIKNRAASSGASPRDVVFAPNQFEPWNGGAARQRLESMDPNSPQYQKILTDVVRPIMSGEAQDPTGGATHFYAPKAQAALGRSAPSWASGTPTVIGNHNFYKVGYGPGSAPAAGEGSGVINPNEQKSPAEMEFPDQQEIERKAVQDFDDPLEQQQVLSAVRSRFATLNGLVKRDRDAISATIPQLEAQALDGHDIQIPEAQIRHVYPPEKAAEVLESLGISKAVAPQFNAVRFGTPQNVADAEAKLSANLGLGGGNPETSDLPDLEGSNEAYRMRQSILKKFQTAVNARHEALNGPKADPASYIATSPLMQQSLQQLGAPMPAGASPEQQQVIATQRAEKFVQDSVSFQQGLGVRVPHVLTRADAAQTVTQIQSADPATADVGKMLADKARSYGQAWPQVFGDLKTLGGLSPEYQTLAQIESPVARSDYQRMLKYVATAPKNRESLYDAAGTPNVRKIEADMLTNPTMQQFEKTAQIPGLRANFDQVQQVQQAVKDLAAFYTLPGGGSAGGGGLFSHTPTALERAVSAVIGDKYAFDTTDNFLRVPVAQTSLKQVQDYGDSLKARLTEKDLQGGVSQTTPQSLGIVNQVGHEHFDEANTQLHLTPQEQFLYQTHLDNLNGPGKVRQPNGAISSLLQTSQEHNGQFYNVPTVWDGKEHTEDEAADHAAAVGWDKWPAYPTRDAAEARYQVMHDYLDRDVKDYTTREGEMARVQKDVVGPIQAAGTNILGNIQRTGKWVTNESDSGAYLAAQDQNGVLKPVKKTDGSRVEFSWKDARGGPLPTATQEAVAPTVP